MIVDVKLTLVLYPNTHGIGYVLCEGPKEIIDFGLKSISRRDSQKYVAKAKEMMDFGKPDIVLLIDREQAKSRVSERIASILSNIECEAHRKELSVCKYSRDQIEHVFNEFKASNKYEMAKVIANWYDQLKSRVPYERREWMAEHYQMGVFDAFSLMLTHYYFKD